MIHKKGKIKLFQNYEGVNLVFDIKGRSQTQRDDENVHEMRRGWRKSHNKELS
jgi:hypothetical protein